MKVEMGTSGQIIGCNSGWFPNMPYNNTFHKQTPTSPCLATHFSDPRNFRHSSTMPPNRETEHRQKRKRHRSRPYPSENARPKKYAVNPLKSRIRDLDRQLSKMERLPADLRIAKERELAALKYELTETKRVKDRNAMVKKYHMVRFFDRRKAERRLKKLEKQLKEVDIDGGQHHSEDAGEREAKRKSLDQQVLKAKVDLSYALYAPLMWKYCALFPKANDGEEDAHDKGEEDSEEQRNRGDPVMWERVRKAMEQGKHALEDLRDGVTQDGDEVERSDFKQTAFTTRSSSKERLKRNQLASIRTSSNTQAQEEEDGDGNDSDGGFFEEEIESLHS